jgi:hypothetical protein
MMPRYLRAPHGTEALLEMQIAVVAAADAVAADQAGQAAQAVAEGRAVAAS